MSYEDTHIDQSETDRINALFVGRSVVGVEQHVNDDDEWRRSDQRVGALTLDDGTRLTIVPNEGCGGCSSGWYYLKALNGCENVITSAEVVEDQVDTGDGYEETRYTLFVFADNEKVNLATVEGDDGNGYYGTGFQIVVKGPSA